MTFEYVLLALQWNMDIVEETLGSGVRSQGLLSLPR